MTMLLKELIKQTQELEKKVTDQKIENMGNAIKILRESLMKVKHDFHTQIPEDFEDFLNRVLEKTKVYVK